jgi:hypothetical protein
MVADSASACPEAAWALENRTSFPQVRCIPPVQNPVQNGSKAQWSWLGNRNNHPVYLCSGRFQLASFWRLVTASIGIWNMIHEGRLWSLVFRWRATGTGGKAADGDMRIGLHIFRPKLKRSKRTPISAGLAQTSRPNSHPENRKGGNPNSYLLCSPEFWSAYEPFSTWPEKPRILISSGGTGQHRSRALR